MMDEQRLREIVREEMAAAQPALLVKFKGEVFKREQIATLMAKISQEVRDGAILSIGAIADAEPSRRFKIDDEAIPAFWDGLRRELDELAAPDGLPEAVAEVLRHLFLGIVANFGKHVFEGVTLPADGASESVLGLRISGAFKGLMTRSALDLLSFVSHGDSPKSG